MYSVGRTVMLQQLVQYVSSLDFKKDLNIAYVVLYRVSIKYFPDYKHYKKTTWNTNFFLPLLKLVSKKNLS